MAHNGQIILEFDSFIESEVISLILYSSVKVFSVSLFLPLCSRQRWEPQRKVSKMEGVPVFSTHKRVHRPGEKHR